MTMSELPGDFEIPHLYAVYYRDSDKFLTDTDQFNPRLYFTCRAAMVASGSRTLRLPGGDSVLAGEPTVVKFAPIAIVNPAYSELPCGRMA